MRSDSSVCACRDEETVTPAARGHPLPQEGSAVPSPFQSRIEVGGGSRVFPKAALHDCRAPVSSPGEHGPETGVGQDPGDGLPLVPLDFDAALFDGAAAAAGLLHLAGELLLFGQTDPHEVRNDRYGLPAASGLLTNDIDAAAAPLPWGWLHRRTGRSRRRWGKGGTVQHVKRTLPEVLRMVGCLFWLGHDEARLEPAPRGVSRKRLAPIRGSRFRIGRFSGSRFSSSAPNSCGFNPCTGSAFAVLGGLLFHTEPRGDSAALALPWFSPGMTGSAHSRGPTVRVWRSSFVL